MYDLIIIGGGPGAVAAAVYAARKKIKFLLITESFGGQSVVSADVQNWIGTPSISGLELGQMFERHLKAQEGNEILEGELVEAVAKIDEGFEVKTKSGQALRTKFILIATGSRRRKLGIAGESEFDGKGVVYCSTCDAPIFKNKTVVIVGGGNSGLEAVLDSLPYAAKIYLMEKAPALRGDSVTQEKIKKDPKVMVMTEVEPIEVMGEKFVKTLKYKDLKTGEIKELLTDGVFVEIGAVPNSDFVKDLVQLNKIGEIAVDHKTQQTSAPGIWAVGDVSDVLYKQNNISAGDGVKALMNIYETLNKS